MIYIPIRRTVRFRSNREYWFGLHKVLRTDWYDENPSTYRNWIGDEPNDPDRCVVYTANGFDDENCDQQRYYTCKKSAGSISVSVMHYMQQIL